MSKVLNGYNLSNERANLINEIQEVCLKKKCWKRIEIDTKSAIGTTLVIGPSAISLEFKNLNIVQEPHMPSKVLFSKFLRPGNDKKYFGKSDKTPITGDEIEKAVDCLIQTIENNCFASVSEKFQDCSVCLEKTNLTTKCHHPLCKNCWEKIEKRNEMGQDPDSDDYEFARCPICRKSQH